jgi:aerobic-type carbon monoxide dehydrogenase small subunit (CoxS/CutS family)
MAQQKDREEKETPSQISRREFLKDAGLIVGGATIGSMAIMGACSGDTKTVTETVTKTAAKTEADGTVTVTKTVTGDPVQSAAACSVINITVNGQQYETMVKSEWSLQHLLRTVLGWTDVKDMCTGYGACGSCAVILEGRAVLSCMVLAIECDGMSVQTAQGIAQEKHPVIESYTKYHTWQCGYCTPGFIVTAKALLDKKSNPTDEEIKAALGGNLCRCGTYQQHIPAVKDAATVAAGGS